MKGAHILAIGGAHLDRRGRIAGETIPAASNPGSWREEAGGGVFNAACNLARLGHRVRLVSPRGSDDAADTVAAAAAEAGIDDTPLTFLDRRTASYTAILSQNGDLAIALADMDIYDVFGPRQIARRGLRDAIGACDAVLTDANLPAATLETLAAACASAGRPLFGIAISPAKVARFSAALTMLSALFMNSAEAAALGGGDDDTATLVSRLRAAGLQSGVVTAGSNAAVAFSRGRTLRLQPPPIGDVHDVTGAGDALAAGFIDATLSGYGLADALRAGVAAAGLAVRSPSSVSEALNPETLNDAISLVPEPETLS